MKIFLICGKARHGKNTVAEIIENHYDSRGYEAIQTCFSKYIRQYTIEIKKWDGKDETKPREFMQELGTEVIRKKMGKEEFFIKRMIEDLEVYENYADVVIINDIRFPLEIEKIKEYDNKTIVVNVNRINFDSDLSSEEQLHDTEVSLNTYSNYDYELTNDTLEKLEKDVIDIIEGIEDNEEY